MPVAGVERKKSKAQKEGVKLPSEKPPSEVESSGAPAAASSRFTELPSRIFDSALRAVSSPFTGGARTKEQERATLKKVVQRLQRQDMALCWNTWVWHWEESRRLQRIMSNALRAMHAPQMARGWYTWQQFHEERVYANALMRNVIVRLSRGKQVDAIIRWREHALQGHLKLVKPITSSVPPANPCSILARCLQC